MFASFVCPTILGNAHSMGIPRVTNGGPTKLTPEQCLLNFIVHLKHDNVVAYESFQWNVDRSSLCDDAIFIASCINVAFAHEIYWSNEMERRRLASINPHFPGCFGIIDGVLVKIWKPWNNSNHAILLNGHKKVYCMNYTVVVLHKAIFVHLDLTLLGIMLLRLSTIPTFKVVGVPTPLMVTILFEYLLKIPNTLEKTCS
jgi:hypothetical protein